MRNKVDSSNGSQGQYLAPTEPELTEQQIYTEVYGTPNFSEVEETLRRLPHSRGVCGKRLEKRDIVWTCKVCAKDRQSIICDKCYEHSKHLDHGAVWKRNVQGGTCDCGDPEFWELSGSCQTHAAGFADETILCSSVLPEPMRAHADQAFDHVVDLLNSSCLCIDSMISSRGQAAGEGLDPGALETAKRQATIIVHALGHFANDIHKVFVHMAAARLRRYSLKLMTEHECHPRSFDSAEEKEQFAMLCKMAEAEAESRQKQSTRIHACTCTVIENFMRVHHAFDEKTQLFFNERLLVPLMGNRRLKHFMALGYFANYGHILPHTHGDPSSLTYVALQFVSYEDVVLAILQNPCYVDNIFHQLHRILNEVEESVHTQSLPSSRLCQQLAAVYHDLKNLIKAKHVKLYHPLIARFVRALVSLHGLVLDPLLSNPTPISQQLLDMVHNIEELVERCFGFMLTTISLTNIGCCRRLAQNFLEAFAILHALPTFRAERCCVLVLHRCLSKFLVVFLIANYWLELPNLTESTVRAFILKSVKSLFGFSTDDECQRFSHSLLPQLLHSVGLLGRIQAGDLPSIYATVATTRRTGSLDYPLAILLVLCLLPREDLLEFLVKSMHPGAKDLAYILDQLRVKSKESVREVWVAAAKLGTRSESVLKQVLEQSLYAICCWISNDIMCYPTLIDFYKSKLCSQEAVVRTREIANGYFEYMIVCYIVNFYVWKASQDEVTNAEVQNEFREGVRDASQIQKCLEFLTTSCQDPADRVCKFRLLSKSLKLFDPFLFFVKPADTEPVPRSVLAMKRVQSPRIFDYYFGEFNEEFEISAKTKCGLPYNPFRPLLRETLGKGNTVRAMYKLLVNVLSEDAVTPWTLRCVYKLAIACGPHCEEPMRVKEVQRTLMENLGRLATEADLSRDVLTEYLRLLGGEGEDDGLVRREASPPLELKRQWSEEQQLKKERAQQRAHAEFAAKIAACKKSNKTFLDSIHIDPTLGSYICSYCREAVNAELYRLEPFGHVTYIQFSSAYGHHLNNVLRGTANSPRREDLHFPWRAGLTQGAVMSTCGHYLHIKCLSVILHNPPDNPVARIDAQYSPGTFSCPMCQCCANELIPPYEVIIRNELGFLYAQDSAFPQLKHCSDIVTDAQVLTMNPMQCYSVLCESIAYQLNLIDFNSVEDFALKRGLVLSLVYSLKGLFQRDLQNNLVTVHDNLLLHYCFLVRGRHRLQNADMIMLYTEGLVAAKILETTQNEQAVYTEVKNKIKEVIKLSLIQILLHQAYVEVGPAASYETVETVLNDAKITAKLGNLAKFEALLVPMLQKLLSLKVILFPTPKRDNAADLQKAAWLETAGSLGFYIQALDLTDAVPTWFQRSRTAPPQPVYLRLPFVSESWLKRCCSSVRRHVKKHSIAGIVPAMPRLLCVYASSMKRFSLLPLAEDYNEMQRLYAGRKCKSCKNANADGAICLLCGESLCVASLCCSKEGKGELTQHSTSCPGGCGMYLRLLDNKVLLVDGAQVCTYPSPYVNKYGESIDTQKHPDCGRLTCEIRIVEELRSMYVLHRVRQSLRSISLRAVNRFKPLTL